LCNIKNVNRFSKIGILIFYYKNCIDLGIYIKEIHLSKMFFFVKKKKKKKNLKILKIKKKNIAKN